MQRDSNTTGAQAKGDGGACLGDSEKKLDVFAPADDFGPGCVGGEEVPEKTEALKKQELRSLVESVDGLQRGSGKSRFEAERLELTDKPAWFKQRIN